MFYATSVNALEPAGPMEYAICIDLGNIIVYLNTYPAAYVKCLPGPPAVA